MIAYKYKLYHTDRTKHLDKMLREACFVWNHALAIQRRYYGLFHKYIPKKQLKKHFAKRIKRNLLHSQTVQEILDRLDNAYQRFFKRLAKRPPKFRRVSEFSSFVFRQGGYSLDGNTFTINKTKKKFRFSLSRPYEGTIKMVTVKRSPLGEYYLILCLDKHPQSFGKTHDGASVGIDFGLKHNLTLSNGSIIDYPQFLKKNLKELKTKSRNLSKCTKGSNNRARKRLELDRLYEKITNSRRDFQWNLAHQLCRHYDYIFVEDLSLKGMTTLWGRKMSDIAHGEFISILEYVAFKYGVTVHKINRFYPSSKSCTCGYVNHTLQLKDRSWVCPACGTIHDRDLLAANNILRQGIADLESVSKSKIVSDSSQSRLHPRILRFQA